MPSLKKKSDFLGSIEGTEIENALKQMEIDTSFYTTSSYSANSDLYPDHRISFTEKHMRYLSQHQKVDPSQYLANLRLMTRVR